MLVKNLPKDRQDILRYLCYVTLLLSLPIYTLPASAQIISPTNSTPGFFESVEATDVMIEYQIDSTEIDALSLVYGMYVGIDIYHESDMSEPVYSYLDPNVLTTTSTGETRQFHWNGYTNTNTRAIPGRYSIHITVYNHNFSATTWTEQENNAIIIAVSDISIAEASDDYLSRHGVKNGEDGLNVNYALSPVLSYDEVVLTIYSSDDIEIARMSNTSDLDGSISWNGWTLDSDIVMPGDYTVEVMLKRSGVSLGVSERHPFIVYEVDLQASGILENDEETPGVFLPAGQESNITLSFDSVASGLTGSVHLAVSMASDSVEFFSGGVPIDLATGVDLPLADLDAGFVFSARSTNLDHVPVELVADYLPSTAPVHKRETDKVKLVLTGIDMDVDADRDGVVEESYEDDIDEDIWAIGAGNKGAIILVNSDDDDGNHLPDNWAVHSDIPHYYWDTQPNDNVINTGLDVDDIAPLIIRKINLPAFPEAASITLIVTTPSDDPSYYSGYLANQRLRIFHPNATSGSDNIYVAGAEEIIGPDQGASIEFVNSPGSTQRDISLFLGEGNVKFGMEGIVYGSMVDVLVEYRDGADVYSQDKVRIRAAPFILYSHVKAIDTSATAGETLFVEDWHGSADLRITLNGEFGSDHVDEADAHNDVWHQDGYDSGYQTAPYKSMPVVFGLPRGGARGKPRGYLNEYTQDVLLRPGVGIVHNFQYLKDSGGDFRHGMGGNLESIPGAPKRFLHGSHMDVAITDFLSAQGVQRQMEVDTSFLNVGHVDELVSYAPDGRHVLVSSPEVAWALLLIAANVNEDAIMLQGIDPLGAGGATVREVIDNYESFNFDFVLDPFNFPRFRAALNLGSAASVPQLDSASTSEHIALSRAGGLIGFIDSNRIRTFRMNFSSDTEFSIAYQDGDDDSWTPDGNGSYGENFISDSRTAFIFARWWLADRPASGDVYTFTVNPRSKFIEVPVIFRDAGGVLAPLALAFTKNNVNSLVSSETIVTAETVGPTVNWGDGAHDIFGYYIGRVFSRAGYSNVVFADEVEYHNLYGSIHCGTNVLRNIPARHWWE